MHLTRTATALALLLSVSLRSQEAIDLAAIDRIKAEAFTGSRVMEDLRGLTDLPGGRLTGSPQFDVAAKWAVDRLTKYGVTNAHLEPWGPFGRSWSVECTACPPPASCPYGGVALTATSV